MTQARSAKVAYTPDRRPAHELEARTSRAFIGREMTVPGRVAAGTGSVRARGRAQSRVVVPEGFSTV